MPCGDYKAPLVYKTPTYNKALRLSSDSVQINGKEEKGLSESQGYLIHSFSKITKKILTAFSWGCQILSDKDFSHFRNKLEENGFKNGDSVPMKITEANSSNSNHSTGGSSSRGSNENANNGMTVSHGVDYSTGKRVVY